ncbi:MAG TPA: ABC transporter substrate-binding protein, partial [Thermomicrobiales bacterium]|nr:ABC transporter substrate-binding protein [Thermomicrobiales bacterium]
ADTTVLQFPGLTWGHLDLKNVGALAETDVRQALDFATPREQIIEKVLGNTAQPAAADQAPGSGYASQRIHPRPLDLDQSAAHLTAAGFTRAEIGHWSRDGVALEIDLWGEQGDTQAEAILTTIGKSWSAAGIATRINLAPADVLWGPTGYQFNDRLTAGFYRWANVNDPDDMYYWHSSQIPTWPGGPGGNLLAFFNPFSFQSEIDDLTSRAAAQTDPVLRKNIYLQIQDLLHEQVPVIFLFWDYGYSAVSNTIGNYLPSAFTYLLWNAREWYQTEPE